MTRCTACPPEACRGRVPTQDGGWACRFLLERGLLGGRRALGDRVAERGPSAPPASHDAPAGATAPANDQPAGLVARVAGVGPRDSHRAALANTDPEGV